MWGLSSLELCPHCPCGPLIPGLGGRKGPPLCVPSFLFGKKLKLKENLQGIPSGHHLLFTLKFQKHAKYRKIANICFLLPPTPPPHAPSQTSLSRQDSLPLGSFLVPRSEPPPPTYLDGEPASPASSGRPRASVCLLWPLLCFSGPRSCQDRTPSPPVSRDAEDTSHFGGILLVPRRVQTALGAGPTASDRSPPQSTAGGARGPVCPMLRARTPAERPAGDSGRPSAARVGLSLWGA